MASGTGSSGGRAGDHTPHAVRGSGAAEVASAQTRRDAPSPEEARRLVHELQVHQVELEVQNEELRRTQEELEASRARYFNLYDQAPVGYVTVSRQGLVVEANLAAAALLGVDRSALVERPFIEFVGADDRDVYHLQRSHLGESGSRDSWEMRMTRADGTPFWAHVQIALTQGGEHWITLDDISGRKRMEAALAMANARLRQVQKAESLRRMAGAIAHHFNNKLQAVMGNLELAMEGPAAGAASAGRMAEAMQAARQAAEMSTLMLTFVGRADGNRAQLDLSEACRCTEPLLRASLPASVALNTGYASPGPIIQAHADQVQQVLVNLVTNAGDAVGTGAGSVRLAVTTVAAADIPEAHRFPVDWEPGNTAHACLDVTDTGRGIADKDLERIFDPFYSDKAAGSGLGLPVALGIVRSHGGGICVNSQPGRGTTFRVLLPLSPDDAPAAAKKTPESTAGERSESEARGARAVPRRGEDSPPRPTAQPQTETGA